MLININMYSIMDNSVVILKLDHFSVISFVYLIIFIFDSNVVDIPFLVFFDNPIVLYNVFIVPCCSLYCRLRSSSFDCNLTFPLQLTREVRVEVSILPPFSTYMRAPGTLQSPKHSRKMKKDETFC